jgi:dynein heavy chain
MSQRENFLAILIRSNQDCDVIRQGLRHFLEKKRSKFPRLYFLSNEELVDIFGRGVLLVSAMVSGEAMGFISHLFEGIEALTFSDDALQMVTHMKSKDGEAVELVRDVATKNMNADAWLSQFELCMVATIKDYLFQAFKT